MQGGVLFFAASLSAALINYLFQVVASKQLSPKEFADLNAWVANLAPFMVSAAVLQYYSNFKPITRGWLRTALVAAAAVSAAAVIFWPYSAEIVSLPNSAVIVAVTAMMAWFMGQTQIRLSFVWLSIGGLALAASRLGFVLWPIDAGFGVFVFANLVAPAVAIWVLLPYLWKSGDVEGVRGRDFWRNTLVLSAAGAMLPQFDVFVMNHSQGEEAFIAFAKASLFGRAVYALTTILAQWLLPNQLRGIKSPMAVSLRTVIFGLLVLCAALAAVSDLLALHLLGWDQTPPRLLVFFASAEISMVAVILVLIQGSCARNETRRAVALLGLLGAEAAMQIILKLPMMVFLPAALVIQISAILIFDFFKDHRV